MAPGTAGMAPGTAGTAPGPPCLSFPGALPGSGLTRGRLCRLPRALPAQGPLSLKRQRGFGSLWLGSARAGGGPGPCRAVPGSGAAPTVSPAGSELLPPEGSEPAGIGTHSPGAGSGRGFGALGQRKPKNGGGERENHGERRPGSAGCRGRGGSEAGRSRGGPGSSDPGPARGCPRGRAPPEPPPPRWGSSSASSSFSPARRL